MVFLIATLCKYGAGPRVRPAPTGEGAGSPPPPRPCRLPRRGRVRNNHLPSLRRGYGSFGRGVGGGRLELEAAFGRRFYLDLNALITAGFTSSNQASVIHRMTDTTAPFSSDQVVVRVTGGSSPSPTVRFSVSDLNPASHITQVAIPLPASANNQYRIEYDMQIGSGSTTPVPGLPALPAGCTAMPAAGNGCIRMWVSDAAATSSDTAPDASITFNDTGWSGAKTSNLGMQSGSPGFRTNHAGTVLRFDEYDSRRQTFIGK